MNPTGVFRMGKQLVDSKSEALVVICGNGRLCGPCGLAASKLIRLGWLVWNFSLVKMKQKHYGKSTKVENGTLAEEADWGSRLATFHGVRQTHLISFVGYRSVSSNVWALHEQRPQPHRRSLVRENGNTVHWCGGELHSQSQVSEVLYHRPQFAILDECTSAVQGSEIEDIDFDRHMMRDLENLQGIHEICSMNSCK